ncbi:MAG: choline-sulfatase [Gaiella sp.]
MPGGRPHLLLIVVDQLSALYLRSYGHPVTRTPAIDRLAAEGVLFANAYTPSPLCAPGRAALMTGLLPHRTGVYDNAAEFRSSLPTFAHYLRLQGYRTCLSGKMHFVGPDQLHGFEERLTTDVYPADYGWTPDWSLGSERIDWWYHNMASVKQAGTAEITNQLEFDDEVAFHAVRRLYDHARYEPETPLALCVSFTHPHDPYVARPRFWDLYADGEIDPPAAPGLCDDPHSRRLYEMSDMGSLELGPDAVLAARHGYYASLSYVDEKIGELLDALDALGLADDTVTVFTSDHGDFLGEHGLFYKMSFREHAARVPLVVHAPGRFAGRRAEGPATLLDLCPTLVELGGGQAVELAWPVDGQSLLPLLDGAVEDAGGRVARGLYLAEGVVAPMSMARRGPHKLIRCPGDPDQLFDLQRDPLELANLATDPEHAATVAELAEIATAGIDLETLTAEVLASQQARLAVFKALQCGARFPWDYQPLRKASEQYTRNNEDVAARDRRSRFPAG